MGEPLLENMTIMFTDVVGSSLLYEKYGDIKAQKNISLALNSIKNIVREHSGEVIKAAGDDALCVFNSADNAITAACEIHDSFAGAKSSNDFTIAFHIGIHSGTGIVSEGDIFGDAVNVAARLTSTAKAWQILTSEETILQLSDSISTQARKLDTIPIKGRIEPVHIYDIIWNHTGDETCMTRIDNQGSNKQSLILQTKNQSYTILYDHPSVILGRSTDSQIIVTGSMVSRQHASIEYNRNKFILKDLSSNGTYLRIKNEDIFIKNEAFPITSEGIISLGKKVDDQSELNIKFQSI